jgi:hypothetical protein
MPRRWGGSSPPSSTHTSHRWGGRGLLFINLDMVLLLPALNVAVPVLPLPMVPPAPYLQYLDYGFTSGMEEQLDVVSGGWVRFLAPAPSRRRYGCWRCWEGHLAARRDMCGHCNCHPLLATLQVGGLHGGTY